MSRQLFELGFTEGPTRHQHRREHGDLATEFPWSSLDPSRYPLELVERARIGWTENAFSEYRGAIAMAQLLQAMGEALVPLDLWTFAARFPLEEMLHAELCSRVAAQLGGGAPLAFETSAARIEFDEELSPLEIANELVVRICCVSETVSLPVLQATLRVASHPLLKSVFARIIQDELRHSRMGWQYLEWVEPELSPTEKKRLACVAEDALRDFTSPSSRMTSQADGIRTSEGFLVQHIHELGWLDSESYRRELADSIERNVRVPLGRFGIHVTKPESNAGRAMLEKKDAK